MLITIKVKPKEGTDPAMMVFSNQLFGPALDVSPGVTTVEEAMKDKAWHDYIEKAITRYNKDPEACVSRAQTVKKFKFCFFFFFFLSFFSNI